METTRIPKYTGAKGCEYSDGTCQVTVPLPSSNTGEKVHTPSTPVFTSTLPNGAGRGNIGLPKSRTMSMLSTLTSSFSRSNLSSSHSKGHIDLSSNIRPTSSIPSTPRPAMIKASASINNLCSPRTAVHTIITTPSALASKTNREPSTTARSPLEHHEAMPSAYWVGRLQGIHDRLGNERLQQTLNDLQQKELLKGPESLQEESDNRYRQAFMELQGLCITKEAKKSLYDFQQEYARRVNNPLLLPVGGHMKGGWKARRESLKAAWMDNHKNYRSDE